MSTPKPGQIRCPTCLRSTPPAAFCTQCGSPIPASARARPRGLDRDELEERVRRRPGEGPFRRGSQLDASPERAGYVPFEPEPEDSLALRPEEEESTFYTGPQQPPDDATRPIATPPPATPPPAAEPPRPQPPAAAEPQPWPSSPPPQPAPQPAAAAPPPPPPDDAFDPYAAGDLDDRPYGEPEDAYAYPYVAADERGGGGGGGGALPIIGFVVLCVLALAVGAVLAGLLGGDNGVGQQTPTPSASASVAPSVEPTQEPTPEPSQPDASATQQPQDGPVAFDDGALLTVQPCATSGYRDSAVGKPEQNACQVDGASVSNGEVWAFIVFRETRGSDTLTVRLLANGQAINEQEVVLGSVLTNCGNRCNGLIYGAHYVDLLPGDYELVLRRNGDFADRTAFTVEN